MRKRNKPFRFRRSNEHVAAAGKRNKNASPREGKRSKDGSPREGKHSKIVDSEKPVQLDHVRNAEDMDNIDPSLLFYDEEDYNKLQAMKEVDRELILARRFEQFKMIRDMNAALKAAEDKEKEQSAEMKEKASATCVNEEEQKEQSPTNQMAEEEQSPMIEMTEEALAMHDEAASAVRQLRENDDSTEQSPMIEMTEEELAMHDEAASAAQKLRENDDSTDFGGTTASVKETEVIDFSINEEIYNDPFSESYIENGLEVLAHASASGNQSGLAPCVICNEVTSNDYRCRRCGHRVHHFCAVPEGKEGHGNHYLCSMFCLGEPVTRSESENDVEGSDYGVAVGSVEGSKTEELDSNNFGKYYD
jgi:hypothetical protein